MKRSLKLPWDNLNNIWNTNAISPNFKWKKEIFTIHLHLVLDFLHRVTQFKFSMSKDKSDYFRMNTSLLHRNHTSIVSFWCIIRRYANKLIDFHSITSTIQQNCQTQSLNGCITSFLALKCNLTPFTYPFY